MILNPVQLVIWTSRKYKTPHSKTHVASAFSRLQRPSWWCFAENIFKKFIIYNLLHDIRIETKNIFQFQRIMVQWTYNSHYTDRSIIKSRVEKKFIWNISKVSSQMLNYIQEIGQKDLLTILVFEEKWYQSKFLAIRKK